MDTNTDKREPFFKTLQLWLVNNLKEKIFYSVMLIITDVFMLVLIGYFLKQIVENPFGFLGYFIFLVFINITSIFLGIWYIRNIIRIIDNEDTTKYFFAAYSIFEDSVNFDEIMDIINSETIHDRLLELYLKIDKLADPIVRRSISEIQDMIKNKQYRETPYYMLIGETKDNKRKFEEIVENNKAIELGLEYLKKK